MAMAGRDPPYGLECLVLVSGAGADCISQLIALALAARHYLTSLRLLKSTSLLVQRK